MVINVNKYYEIISSIFVNISLPQFVSVLSVYEIVWYLNKVNTFSVIVYENLSW